MPENALLSFHAFKPQPAIGAKDCWPLPDDSGVGQQIIF
jgi:hypothetical protein